MIIISFLAVLLIGCAAFFWLLQGHPSLTNFSRVSDWSVTPSNFTFFGAAAFMFLSTELPMNMAGEIRETDRSIRQHLFWGTLIICLGYLMTLLGLMIIGGQQAAFNLISPLMVVNIALGKFFGSMMVFCILAYCLMLPTAYNIIFSRLLLAGAIDGRLPLWLGKLNQHRVPANAILLQTGISVVIAGVLFLVPYISPHQGSLLDFASGVYSVVIGAAALIWMTSVAFLFIDLIALFCRFRGWFCSQRMIPIPILGTCVIFGLSSCCTALIQTLTNSWVPQLIPNSQWWWLIGGLTVICFCIAAGGGMLARIEAEWQQIK